MIINYNSINHKIFSFIIFSITNYIHKLYKLLIKLIEHRNSSIKPDPLYKSYTLKGSRSIISIITCITLKYMEIYG